MNKIQRAKLVGLIFEYGNALGRRVAEAGVHHDGPSVEEVEAVAEILALLDTMTER